MNSGYNRQVTKAGGVLPAGDQLAGLGSKSGLEEALEALENLDISKLQMRWRELFSRNAPARLGVDPLRRAIANRLQELELGGLSRQALLRLRASSGRVGKTSTGRGSSSSPALVKPGTRFVREWQNDVHEVQAIDTGDFVYRGKTFRSLSLIAKAITGTHQSGPRFFGIGKNVSAASNREAIYG